MLAWLIPLLILLFLGWFLFSPMIVHADTERNEYSFRLDGFFITRVLKTEEEWWVRFYLFSVPVRRIQLGKIKGTKGKQRKERKIKRLAFRAADLPGFVKVIIKLIRTFKVKNFHLDIDTGDVILNAYLYPFPLLWRTKRIYVNINFDDENILVMTLRNRMIRIIPVLFSLGIMYYRIKRRS